jgi:hypothetical protein
MRRSFKTFGSVVLVALSLAGPAQAFRSTDVESYTDPDYEGYRPARVLLTIVGDSAAMRRMIEERIVEDLEKKGVTVFAERDLFTPTRQWTAEERSAVFAKRGVDGQLTISVGASAASLIPMMMNSHTTVAATGGSFAGTTTSYPVFAARSTAEFSGVLLDLKAHRVVWYADVFTKAAGLAFVGAKGDAKGAVKGIVDGLEADGHIGKRR